MPNVCARMNSHFEIAPNIHESHMPQYCLTRPGVVLLCGFVFVWLASAKETKKICLLADMFRKVFG